MVDHPIAKRCSQDQPPFVALFASVGRSYLFPLGWVFFTLAFGQVAAITGWSWFPWFVPVLFSGMPGLRAEQIGMHSNISMSLAFIAGGTTKFAWWWSVDQAR